MRAIRSRRVLAVLIALPLFIIQWLINSIFLRLDDLFFFWYRRRPTSKMLLITGVPRSATTFMLHKLARNREAFTCFTLGEMLFAPSIGQKIILLGFRKVDGWMGRPSRLLDRVFFGKFRSAHLMGFGIPEEDETLFLWNFSSAYFLFFFPDTTGLDHLLRFDDSISSRQKKRIMRYYKRCIQRHLFVFDRKREKIYLSKNPVHLFRLESFMVNFPTAQVVVLERPPWQTVPSSFALYSRLWKIWSSVVPDDHIFEHNLKMVMEWYELGRQGADLYPESVQAVHFGGFIENPDKTLSQLYFKLEIGLYRTPLTPSNSDNHKSKLAYPPLKPEHIQLICKELPYLSFDINPPNLQYHGRKKG